VTRSEAETIALKYNVSYHEMSAKTGEGLLSLFEIIGEEPFFTKMV